MTLVLLFAAGLFLAYANGANDNFKGVATLLLDQAHDLHVVADVSVGEEDDEP